jgi:VanZ family protein
MRWLLVVWLAAWAIFSFPWMSATSTPHWERVTPPRVRATSRIRLDHVLNLLFYVPAAPIGAALGYSLPACIVAGTTLSLTAETTQVFSLDRSPGANDVIANILGTAVGAILVLLYRRRRLADEQLRGP